MIVFNASSGERMRASQFTRMVLKVTKHVRVTCNMFMVATVGLLESLKAMEHAE